MIASEMQAMDEEIKASICSKTWLSPYSGPDCYLVHTWYFFGDGDEYHIVLEKRDGRWILTDDGHTMMWLSYDEFNLTETRKRLLLSVLSENGVTYDNGCLVTDCTGKDMGECILGMIKSITQTVDLSYLSRRNVRNTYADDIKQMMKGLLGNRCKFDKRICHGDESYLVDICFEGEVPFYAFSITNRGRCKDALITIMALRETDPEFISLVFVDDNVDVGKDILMKLTNRADKLFHNRPDEELGQFFEKIGIKCEI